MYWVLKAAYCKKWTNRIYIHTLWGGMRRFVLKLAEHRLSSVQQILRKEHYLKKYTKHYNNLIFDAYLWVLGTEETEYELQIARINFLRPLVCVTKRDHQRKNVRQKNFTFQNASSVWFNFTKTFIHDTYEPAKRR